MYEGKFTDQNIDRSYNLLNEIIHHKSKKQKNLKGNAHLLLAIMYENECIKHENMDDTKHNYKYACENLIIAANKYDNSEAYNTLGIFYQNGLFVKDDGTFENVNYKKSYD